MPATEDYLRPLPKMHRWFAVSMIVLFLATLLMMYFDHHDEWRAYQHQFFHLQAEKIVAEENAKKAQLVGVPVGMKSAMLEKAYAAKVNDLQEAKSEAQTKLDRAVEDLAEQESNLKKLDNDYLMQMRKVRENRAYRDVARANFDLGVRDQVEKEKLQKLFEEFRTKQTTVETLETELDLRDDVRNRATAELKAKTKDRDAALAAIKLFEADIVRLETAKDRIQPEPTSVSGALKTFKRWFMEQPIIDGFNSHIRVKQDWLPDMKITLGMAKTSRFDRCRTCHLAIDMVGPGNVPDYPHGDGKNGTYQHPFSTHPRPDVYLTAASPHPLNDFGCTSCHDGQGSGTSFQNASHTPNDPHQAHDWEHNFKWFNNHFWEYPMQPARLREAACLKCHHSVVELGQNTRFGATAPKAYQGWQLIKKYGCFGCHEINGFDAGKQIGPDLRLEPQTPAEAKKIAEDPKAVAGVERKVGPSLRHIASKTTRDWLTHWTEEPKRFRPTTNMPQFFKLSNNSDAHGQEFSKLELAVIAEFLFDNSKALKVDLPQPGYEPSPIRGKQHFAQKGCLACHGHEDPRFKNSRAEFGPNLTKVYQKVKAGDEGFAWLYTWIREPERHHARTRMPDLFIDPQGSGENYVDPAADIAAYLLTRGLVEKFVAERIEKVRQNIEKLQADIQQNQQGIKKVQQQIRQAAAAQDTTALNAEQKKLEDEVQDFKTHIQKLMPDLQEQDEDTAAALTGIKVVDFLRSREAHKYETLNPTDEELDRLVEMLLWRRKTVTPAQAKEVMTSRKYPYARDTVKGDEIELVAESADDKFSNEEWRRRKMNYLGRVTVSRYGCYGCHDIPKFETARPIGTALQDWGLKDPSRLAPEHIEEFLHHHGEPDGSSTATRVENAIRSAETGDYDSQEHKDQELSAAFFYDSLMHHGRPGFLWQKLRDPRSYDYEKTSTKFYDERLRMPKFPLSEREIEAISTFVLGLVARPPAEKYQYKPKGAELAKVEGEKLLQKFNCTGCHMIDLPEVAFGTSLKDYKSGFAESLVAPEPEPGQPTNAKAEELARIQRLVEFFQHVSTLADEVQKGSQIVFLKGIGAPRPSLFAAEELRAGADPSEEWNQTIERLRKLKDDLGKLPEPTKLTLLDNESFKPFASEQIDNVKQESLFSKRVQARLDGIKSGLSDEKLKPKSDRHATLTKQIQPIADLAAALSGVLDQFVLADWSPLDHRAAIDPLFKMKPPHSGVTGSLLTLQRGAEKETLPVIAFKGLVNSRPEPGADIEDRFYSYTLWEPLQIAQRLKFPFSTMSFNEADLVSLKPSRGGAFAEWLSDELLRSKQEESRVRAWQASPPPLALEGFKVQTPWLYAFLKNPYQIRHTTALRMPRFNMSDAEAQTLANYFAAYDGAPFPYQDIPQRQPEYLTDMKEKFGKDHPNRAAEGSYLEESWRIAGIRACAGCHEFGGRKYKSLDPKKDIRGPNLEHVQNRLRPEWVKLWLLKPSFITPYTSMPVNFPASGKSSEPLILNGNPLDQSIAARDALFNYSWLMERYGKLPEPQAAPAADEAKPADAKSTEANSGDGGGQ
ncbi:MAG: hypothetical protein ACKV2Q_27850 [Planctomycetaceae bacterium]